jgi:hypothetical protein
VLVSGPGSEPGITANLKIQSRNYMYFK